VTGRRVRTCEQQLNGRKERIRYCKLKEEAVNNTVWGTGYGCGYEPVVRHIAG
jgi:hypothetical protein